MRIDKLLWFLRLVKTRSLAQAVVAEGHLRHNGKRIEQAAHRISVGSILVIPLGQRQLTIEILNLPTRRGPAAEAGACYRVLDERGGNFIAAKQHRSPEGNTIP